MSTVISTHSFRGGTGKSNITANIAATLAQKGKRVGIFDGDIQSPGIHIIFGLNEENVKYTLNDYLWGSCKIEEAAYEVYKAPNGDGVVYMVPASLKANDIARILRQKYDANDMHKAFRNLVSSFSLDFLLLDTHPGLNEETLLSVAISDILIIILRPDQQDFLGTSVTVDLARRLKVPAINLIVNKVPTEFNFDDVKKQVENVYNCPVATLLPLSVDIAQNASSKIFCLYHPDHQFTQGINKVVEGLLT